MKIRPVQRTQFASDRNRAERLGLDPDELHMLQLIARGDDASIMARFRLSRSTFVLAVLRIQMRTGTRSVRQMEKFAEVAGV